MKKFCKAIALTAIFATPAFAQDGHQHGDEMMDRTMGMHDQEMASMHEHMQEMHALMEEIKAEQDPEMRQQLLEEHMDVMQSGMHMMSSSMATLHQPGDKGQDMAPMNMEKCMSMMSEDKNMMQAMMDQMKEHQTQEKKLRKHIHKK
ncbi:MAG: hypothetical protein ACJAST_003558 [Halopseudomonas sp.]|jgi:protein CpxP|tara:strand:- start:3922 stop:4362 length:441 start_codon:yes stop_codon:yes gene_type:complete